MDEKILKLLSADLSRNFGLEDSILLPAKGNSNEFEILIKYLVERINFLIVRDFERLINTLYRIDLDETKVRFAFSKENERGAAEVLAELIIYRQIERIKTRLKYQAAKENGSTGPDKSDPE